MSTQASKAPFAVAALLVLAFAKGEGASGVSTSVRPLTIYFIDVEGGQSTLIVTPRKHSLLIDTGFAGDGQGFKPVEANRARDANRILAATRDAGISQIDELLITHFHPDHDGGVSELAQLIPIKGFIDHGAPNPEAEATSADTRAAFEVYERTRAGKPHQEPRPGDRLPFGEVEITVVSSAGAVLTRPLPHAGQRNAQCRPAAAPPVDPYENPRSTGIILQYGRFRFLDLGDLSGKPLFDLTCPTNLVGHVDVYLVAHHGGPDVADLATFTAFAARVAVMNNGLKKGGARETYETMHRVSWPMDVWQLHWSENAGNANFPRASIANLDEQTSHWLRIEAQADGSFTVLNPGTGESRSYP